MTHLQIDTTTIKTIYYLHATETISRSRSLCQEVQKQKEERKRRKRGLNPVVMINHTILYQYIVRLGD